MNKPGIILKPGRDKAVRNFHHWIFSGAIQNVCNYEDGDILPVFSSRGDLLGSAYCNHQTSITGRMLSFGNSDPIEQLKKNIDSAIIMRSKIFQGAETNCYRLISSEGDSIPGLVVDKYNEVLVMQIATAGIDKLKELIVDYLEKKLKPVAIYEKSDLPSRREEGLQMSEGWVFNPERSPKGGVDRVSPKALAVGQGSLFEILENGLKFKIDLKNSQKTGFFLDQREMRVLVGSLAKDKKVLNCFSYTGGFSLYAAKGEAKQVDSVDISEEAINQSRLNFEVNGLDTKKNNFYSEDVFEFLRENDLNYDLIILDPPAFAKKKNDVVKACRGYKDINRLALTKMPKNSILITSSCSYHVDEKLFQTVVFQAAVEAKRKVRIIGRHHLAPDHPINIFHPEGEYLKSLVLWVE